MKSQPLLIRDWKQDVINLVQFPRMKLLPSPSMFSLKLETWLRFNKLSYTNISNDFIRRSAKGQIPFIELNGRQFADSNFIIEHLIQQYNLPIDRSMTTRERAEARAIALLVEESLARVVMYDRSRNLKWMFTEDQGFLGNCRGVKKQAMQYIAPIKQEFDIKKIVNSHGIGRHTPDEVDEIAKKDLAALSVFLGEKRFFFGDRPTTVDATIFGTLAQFVYTPFNSDKIKPFLDVSTQNLVEFVARVRDEFWPDWALTCETLNLNAHLPSSTTTTAAAAGSSSSRALSGSQPPPPSAESVLHATSPSQ